MEELERKSATDKLVFKCLLLMATSKNLIIQGTLTQINGISTFTKLIFCQKNAENNF